LRGTVRDPERWFELFNKDISANDKPKRNEENKADGEK
jgi:hypothetical protein